jgi:hypothetical protein
MAMDRYVASAASGGEGVVGVRVMHHFDHLAVAEGREVRSRSAPPRPRLGRRSHDAHDVVADTDDVDEFTETTSAESLAHEVTCLHAALAGTGRRRVTAMPLDVRV